MIKAQPFDNVWIVSKDEMQLPGRYATKEDAEFAATLAYETLYQLWEDVKQGVIKREDLEQAKVNPPAPQQPIKISFEMTPAESNRVFSENHLPYIGKGEGWDEVNQCSTAIVLDGEWTIKDLKALMVTLLDKGYDLDGKKSQDILEMLK